MTNKMLTKKPKSLCPALVGRGPSGEVVCLLLRGVGWLWSLLGSCVCLRNDLSGLKHDFENGSEWEISGEPALEPAGTEMARSENVANIKQDFWLLIYSLWADLPGRKEHGIPD